MELRSRILPPPTLQSGRPRTQSEPRAPKQEPSLANLPVKSSPLKKVQPANDPEASSPGEPVQDAVGTTPTTMPAMDPPVAEQAEQQIKTILHHLYALMIQAQDYSGSQTSTAMTDEIKLLIQSLLDLTRTSRDLKIDVPSDIVDYVDRGRNPDIYNREFIETAQQLNQQLKGRSEAYAKFRDTLASAMRTAIPDMADQVDAIVAETKESGG